MERANRKLSQTLIDLVQGEIVAFCFFSVRTNSLWSEPIRDSVCHRKIGTIHICQSRKVRINESKAAKQSIPSSRISSGQNKKTKKPEAIT
jgi:hypothetical protein